MEELWGLKSVLDQSDQVAVFIVGERDDKVLYCNYLVTLMTGRHAESSFAGMWENCREHMKQCGDGRVYRYIAEDTPFGRNRNVTISRIVWQGGKKAYAFMVSPHIESKEEADKEFIFKSLGQSYLSMYILNMEQWQVSMLMEPKGLDYRIYTPIPFETWKKDMLSDYIHPDDIANTGKCLEQGRIVKELEEHPDGFSFQYRRRFGEEYHWTEFRLSRVSRKGENARFVCTERDIHSELKINRNKLENELIMKSLSGIYRSVYLLDMETGEYVTVKPDELLFGIPDDGVYDELMQIVVELIPDSRQQKDLLEYFSLPALKAAFCEGVENIGREYNSAISKGVNWMSISAFRPPYIQGLENKCVITFMDITEHKRVEAERNENNIALDVLSSRYVAVFFINPDTWEYHSIKLPQKYRYLEKQFSDGREAFKHYLSAYVLEEYREALRHSISPKTSADLPLKETTKSEYSFKTVDNVWFRLNIFHLPLENGKTEMIAAFEDYNDIMIQRARSVIYSKIMLADYDGMYEYAPGEELFYELVFDGEKLVCEETQGKGFASFTHDDIHPDDVDMFRAACSPETIKDCFENRKTVNHLFIRRKIDGEYRSFMFGFHYFEEYGEQRVLIMARDAEREIV